MTAVAARATASALWACVASAGVRTAVVKNSADPTGLPLLLVLVPSSQINQTLYAVPAVRPVSVMPTLVSSPLPLVGTPLGVLPLAA